MGNGRQKTRSVLNKRRLNKEIKYSPIKMNKSNQESINDD